MKVGYVDSSIYLGILLEEPRHTGSVLRVGEFPHLFSANLLEAEVRAALTRESVAEPSWFELLDRINWIHPDRPLSREFEAVLSEGYLRGADLWHLACALYLRSFDYDVELLTLDRRQQDVGKQLGLISP